MKKLKFLLSQPVFALLIGHHCGASEIIQRAAKPEGVQAGSKQTKTKQNKMKRFCHWFTLAVYSLLIGQLCHAAEIIQLPETGEIMVVVQPPDGNYKMQAPDLDWTIDNAYKPNDPRSRQYFSNPKSPKLKYFIYTVGTDKKESLEGFVEFERAKLGKMATEYNLIKQAPNDQIQRLTIEARINDAVERYQVIATATGFIATGVRKESPLTPEEVKAQEAFSATLAPLDIKTYGVDEPALESKQEPERGKSGSKQLKIMLVGGGQYPKEAIDRFVEWTGGKDSKILVITWGGGPDGEKWRFDKFKIEIQRAGVEDVVMSPTVAEMENRKGRSRFTDSLADASGVFFTGGDQERIMDCIEEHDLRQLIRKKHADGTPFGGNSAGAAVMADQMMSPTKSGDDFKSINTDWIEFRLGLGMIDSGLIDQHFVERRRQNRLFTALIKSDCKWAVGVDEGNAVSFEDGHIVEVFGEGPVWFVSKSEKSDSQFIVRLVSESQGRMTLRAAGK